jgi:hypothetical protein
MNFAVPGYALEQMARTYEDKARPYRPDLVAFSLTAFDIRPLPPVRVARAYPLQRYAVCLALYEALQSLLRTRGELAPFGYLPDESYASARQRYDELDELVRVDPLGPETETLWQAAEARMDELLALAREDGTRLLLSGLPLLDELARPTGRDTTVRWREWAARRPEVIYADPLPALALTIEPLLRAMRRAGVRPAGLWNLANEPGDPPAVELPGANPFLTHDPKHLSADGHRLLADCVFAALRDAGVP